MPTSAVVTSNALVLVLRASRAHDLLSVSVLVSEVELKLSNLIGSMTNPEVYNTSQNIKPVLQVLKR
jgi:hypothetical protein